MATDLYRALPSLGFCLERPLQTIGHLGTTLSFASSHHLCCSLPYVPFLAAENGAGYLTYINYNEAQVT